jgi:mRNA-degrading endonuclease YafQ of YafQ-DinJ toxin-antitoxin module
LVEVVTVVQTPTFAKTVKKLHPNQKAELDLLIKTLIKDPLLGKQKKGDLAFLRVVTFTLVNQQTLLGYTYFETEQTIELITLGNQVSIKSNF